MRNIRKGDYMDKILMILRKEHFLSTSEFCENEFSVEIYDDVMVGLQKIKEEQPKMVIIDMAIDRIDAIDLLAIIRSNPKLHHMKVVMTSRIYNYTNLKKSFELGADYYLSFPIKREEFDKIYGIVKEQSINNALDNIYKIHINQKKRRKEIIR